MDQPSVQSFIQQVESAFRSDDTNAAAKVTEAANVAVVQQMYAAIARGDFTSLGEFFADDVTFEVVGPAELAMVGAVQGRQQVVERVRSNFAPLEDQRPEVRGVIAQGDLVVVLGREKGRCRPTGRSYEVEWVQVFTIRQGKLQAVREVFDSASMVAAFRP